MSLSDRLAKGDAVQAEPYRLLHEQLGVARPVEEAEVGVRVQFGVRHVGAVARGAG